MGNNIQYLIITYRGKSSEKYVYLNPFAIHWKHNTVNQLYFNKKDKCTSNFTAALFTVAKTWKQLKCS